MNDFELGLLQQISKTLIEIKETSKESQRLMLLMYDLLGQKINLN